MIADYIRSLDGPVVLCGDFNLSPDSESLAQLNAILKNHPIEASLTSTRTQFTQKTEVCDYIFTSPDIQVKRFEMLEAIASDHAALIVEF
jgi:endonuclease/exonuclease/phosphatase (EEP) superfamily protein YafD